MLNFDFYSPTYFAFGKARENEAGELIARFGGTRALLHYGGKSAIKSGLLDRVKDSLESAGIFFSELGGVKPNPESDLVYRGIDLCRQQDIDFILAIGGGSVIDSAKAIAVGMKYDGDFWDFFDYGKRKPITAACPIGTILTLAATGSEASTDSVISHDGGKLKRSISSDLIRPTFSILNPELTYTVSTYQTACGITDMAAHVFERYFTNTGDVGLTDNLCEAVLRGIISQALPVMDDPKNYAARANLMWAGTVAHNNIIGVGREQDWASHLIEHELSAMYGCAHGAGLAVVMPAWMKYVYEHDIPRFARMAVCVWGCQESPDARALALECISKFEAFLKSLGMPTTLGEIGAKPEDIPAIAQNVGFGPYTFGSFVKLDVEATEAILRLAL